MTKDEINWIELGLKLRAARETQGYSIEEAALQTRIAPWIIDSLEKGEVDKLPGLVFAKGFVKNLAKIYAVDAQIFLDFFKETKPTKQNDSSVPVDIKKSTSPQKLKLTDDKSPNELSMKTIEAASKPVLLPWSWIGAIAASLVALAVWISLIDKQSVSTDTAEISQTDLDLTKPVDNTVVEAPPSPNDPTNDSSEFASQETSETLSNQGDSISAQEATTKEVVASVPTPIPQEPIQQNSSEWMNLVLNVKESVQIRLKTDDQSQKTITLEPKSHPFEFKDKAELLIFDASAVQVSFNGEDLGPLGGKGRIRRLSFVRELP